MKRQSSRLHRSFSTTSLTTTPFQLFSFEQHVSYRHKITTDNTLAFGEQGNLQWYSPAALASRRRLALNPRLIREIARFWNVGRDQQMLHQWWSFSRYFQYHQALATALERGLSTQIKRSTPEQRALDDWRRDLNLPLDWHPNQPGADRVVMLWPQFYRSLFQLVDLWYVMEEFSGIVSD